MKGAEKSSQAADIRGRQIHAMESNVPKTLIGYIAIASLSAFVLYPEWKVLLSIWGPIVVFICIARTMLAWRTSWRPVRAMSRRDEILLMVATGVVSVTMASGPTWVALHSDGFVCAMMLMLLVSTMWGGGFVQASVFSSAASFTLMHIPVWIACLAFGGVTMERLNLFILFAITIVVAIDNVYRYAKTFECGLRQQIALERHAARLESQSEVIALLLKEHEDQSSDWLWRIDAGGRIEQPSSRFAEAFGKPIAELDGSRLVEFMGDKAVPGNAEAVATLWEHVSRSNSFRDVIVPGAIGGSPRWWTVSGRPILDKAGLVIGYRGVMGDVTAAKEAQAEVAHLAHHDALTGLANRTRFRSTVNQSLEARDGRLCLISVDLDGFKLINDRYGHHTGDTLLLEVAGRLRATVGERGLAARLGGDEFAIVTESVDTDFIEGLCHDLIESLHAPYRIGGRELAVGVSIGIAVAPANGMSAEELLKNADAALYRAKRDGRGTFRWFEPEMDLLLQRRLSLLQDLREAVGRDELTLHYQPYIDARTGRVAGCEALLRWNHSVRGPISPAEFIPLAEESGLIVRIGAWAIETACRQAASWPEDVRVAVNVSPVQFTKGDLPAQILGILLKTGLQPQRLEIEITETVLIEDAAKALDILRRIRSLGVKLALDDFGTGYSSLGYLSNFPFDKVKIDQSFVAELDKSRDCRVIVQAIRDIAIGLGMTITAEGVETPSQANALASIGCHELQGFLFSKARPETEIHRMLAQGIQTGWFAAGLEAQELDRAG